MLAAATECQYNQTNLTYFSECGLDFPDCNNLPKMKAAFIELSSKSDCADIITGIQALETAASEDYNMPTDELGDRIVFGVPEYCSYKGWVTEAVADQLWSTLMRCVPDD